MEAMEDGGYEEKTTWLGEKTNDYGGWRLGEKTNGRGVLGVG